jgi:xanthine dehydrogenase YagS FAD-binding subunit
MEPFAYAHPHSPQGALGLLGPRWQNSAVLAGGTDLLSLMKEHVVVPQRVVSIRGVSVWSGISAGTSGVRIGALVTLEELLEHPLAKQIPALQTAAAEIASPQIRSMATVAGDLCQRPRCWYFRNGFGLLARDQNGNSLVPNGENKYHAILGNDGPAYFVAPSSLALPLIALDAKVKISSTSGEREIPLREFYRIPQSEDERENVLQPNEVVTEILIPSSYAGTRNATYEVRERTALDWPLGLASVALQMKNGRVASARIVLGQVAPIPWLAEEAAQTLEGKALTAETAAAAGQAAVARAKPLSQNGYKVQLTRVCVRRALLEAARARPPKETDDA